MVKANYIVFAIIVGGLINMVSDEEIKQYRNLALKNKPHLRNKPLWVELDDGEYRFVIKGMGQKAVKLELYVHYEDILDNPDGVIESKLDEMIKTIFEKGAGKAIHNGGNK